MMDLRIKDMAKLFREHRGGLYESLATTIECPNGISDIVAHYKKDELMCDYVKHIYIDPNLINDERLPEDWNGISFHVMAVCSDGKKICIGQSNFLQIID